MNDDITDLVALLGGQITKPSGDEYINTMVGPGAWPEFDESIFDQRKEALSHLKSAVTQARSNWDAVHAKVFNGLFVWFGGGAAAAAAKAEQHSKAMEQLENQLAAAIEWSAKAWLTTRNAKKAIADFVWLTHNAITDLLNKDYENESDKKDAENAAKQMAEQAYQANKQFLDNVAGSLSGEGEGPGPSSSESHAAAPLDNSTSGSTSSGTTQSSGGASGAGSQSSSLMSGDGKGGPREGNTAPEGTEGGAPEKAADGLGDQSQLAPSSSPGGGGGAPAKSADGLGDQSQLAPSSSPGGGGGAPAKSADSLGDQTQATPATPPTVLPNPAQSAPGSKPPTGPVAPSIPSVPSAPSVPSSGAASAASGLSSGGSPASSAASAGAGLDPSKAAGQAPVGAVPKDPLQAFSQGFSDSAGTPVHAASSGGAPPPLAPSPAVPASDAMTPASTAAPVSQAGTPASAAPVQAPASGGSMGGGMGMGGMPLGPPPTAPPAAPVQPAAAPPPAVAPPANIAGGAQVAPIPVSAARAERDAAQNAAKRSGSDPLELARRIAAALNAPDMVNKEEPFFHWITAVTQDGRIVVANNYGLAYMPKQVRLPASVVMASADESIPPSERAGWATYPAVALQGWAQHHDSKLRALIGFENQFGSDSGVHLELLTPQDIPASGKMAGRDRLQVIAPQVAARLAQIADGDLVKVLPPAPVEATPPDERQRMELWEDVWSPVISRSANRGQAHLKGFAAYAVHAQEWALYHAHTSVAAEDQRRAVADFIYWQHVGQLAADAIGG
ncbi:hypothetical protein [Mycolicibacterium farcinogenes]|uniref:hypothetical protein n=1 Tax=Mycolicibacterium farcinogenes TaxID=1802 RepID=UPI0021AD98C3|nr:hypothetical protein [Mycolicibacterium farcinogenes]